jgi:hypothetical protein
VLEVEQELTGNSIAVQSARKMLLINSERVEEGSAIPSSHVSLAVGRILGYRILDIVQWLKMDGSAANSEISNTNTRITGFRFLEHLVSDEISYR